MRQKTDFFSGITHTGKIRENNEDAFLIEKIQGGRYILACVIDGVGGYEGGEIAARLASESILAHLQKPSEDLFLAVRESIIMANERIYAEKMASEQNTRMACVLTVAVIDLDYNQFYYAHVGDTRLYLLRDYTLVKITRDDSFVGFLEDSKRISEEEAMNHPKRNEINKALGFDPNLGAISDYIETGISPFLPGDILLLCSDGLTDMINSKTITSILTSREKIPQKAKALIDSANAAGGKDNITVVLLHNFNKRATVEATRPPALKKKEAQPEHEEDESNGKERSPLRTRSNNGLVVTLLIVCLGLLGLVIWLWANKQATPNTTSVLPVTTQPPSANERKLQDDIRTATTLLLIDSLYGNPILLNDTLHVMKDSLHINGNGMIIKSDSLYNGAAFFVASSCNYLLLENIVFDGFERAIVLNSPALQLKNVQFRNCRAAFGYDYNFPSDKYIDGKAIDTLLFQIDSVPK